MISIDCATESMTQRLGYALGACLRAGDVVLLTGEMGAGKSVLTRAAARGMGVEGPVPSPTFTILNIHEGRAMKLYHFDLYRLEDADALYEMGLEEYIPPEDGAAMIEWPQMAQEAMPADALAIELCYAQDGRAVTLTPMGRFDEGRVGDILRTMEACDEYPCD
ncbi:MAG: tRNA (adenosine(37)-N6)-threonylcarbamoyltransferase complex ATPase subunit type 1 TsaE [Candidatus Ventricola sp.]